MDYIVYLPNDIKFYLFGTVAKSCRVSFVILAHANNHYYTLISQYAIDNKIKRKLTCNELAFNGYLDLLKWAKLNEWDWYPSTCASAAVGGHLEVLKWLRSNGCPWNSKTCRSATYGGHLDVLKWARENGCEWDAMVCAEAAKRGDLDLLKWLRSNGCEWDANTCGYAAYGGSELSSFARKSIQLYDNRESIVI